MRFRGAGLGLFLVGCLGAAPLSPKATIDRYCLGCHTDKVKSGGFSLSDATAKTAAENPEAWEKVIRKLGHRQMPPLGLPRPDEATYTALIDLTGTIKVAILRRHLLEQVPISGYVTSTDSSPRTYRWQ
ncbi:MAG: cytochrome c [Bryobacteraceae bacterium]